MFCVGELADQGAGHPDFGLYSSRQVQRGKPRPGQTPERGVVEVKSADDDAWLTAHIRQVSRYWDRYGLVLVTNTRDFVLLGEDARRAFPPGSRPSGWQKAPRSSSSAWRRPEPSRATLAPGWPSTWAGRWRPTRPCPSRGISPGCWRRTPATGWRGSRTLATPRR